MKKNFIFYLIAGAFFILYFYIFRDTLGRFVPHGPIGNMIVVFIVVIVNIPLSVFSAEKLINAIRKG